MMILRERSHNRQYLEEYRKIESMRDRMLEKLAVIDALPSGQGQGEPHKGDPCASRVESTCIRRVEALDEVMKYNQLLEQKADRVAHACAILSKKSAMILWGYYILGIPVSVLARYYDMSESGIYKLQNRAMRQIEI